MLELHNHVTGKPVHLNPLYVESIEEKDVPAANGKVRTISSIHTDSGLNAEVSETGIEHDALIEFANAESDAPVRVHRDAIVSLHESGDGKTCVMGLTSGRGLRLKGDVDAIVAKIATATME